MQKYCIKEKRIKFQATTLYSVIVARVANCRRVHSSTSLGAIKKLIFSITRKPCISACKKSDRKFYVCC